MAGRAARIAAVGATGGVLAATVFDVGFSTRLGPGLSPYVAAVGDVTHGRAPLVDTASRGGWGSIDLLGAVFTVARPDFGTLALAVSAVAVICALLVLGLAVTHVRPLGAAILVAGASVVVGWLAGPGPDAGAPSSGSMTLIVPLLAAVAVASGAGRRVWRMAVAPICAVGVLWSAPAAALTIAAVAAGVSAWPAQLRRGQARRCVIACAAAIAAYASASFARSGTLPDLRVMLATEPLAASPGEVSATGASIVLGLLCVIALGVVARTAPRRDRLRAPSAQAAARALGVIAAGLATHGLVTGSPVEIAHAAGLTLLVIGIAAPPAGVREAAAFAIALAAVCACAAPTIADRWQTSALYAAIPHQPLEALGLGSSSFDQSLRYNVEVLARGPVVSPDITARTLPLIAATTRRDGERLVLLPGESQADLLALRGDASVLPLGDPTTSDVVGRLRTRLLEAIMALPERIALLTREDWLAGALDGREDAGGTSRAPRQALTLLLERYAEVPAVARERVSDAPIVVQLRRRRSQ